MKQIDKDHARKVFDDRQQAGHHVDSRLIQEIERDGELYVIQIEDEVTFFSLIWQESNPARLLTPFGQPRTVRDVWQRLIKARYTFETLAKDMKLSRSQHHPEWFEPCVPIDGPFDFNLFGWLAVVAANDAERAQSPRGSFYLFDGMRKSLVLAKRLLKKETIFQPIEALYLIPRRN